MIGAVGGRVELPRALWEMGSGRQASKKTLTTTTIEGRCGCVVEGEGHEGSRWGRMDAISFSLLGGMGWNERDSISSHLGWMGGWMDGWMDGMGMGSDDIGRFRPQHPLLAERMPGRAETVQQLPPRGARRELWCICLCAPMLKLQPIEIVVLSSILW